MPRKVQYSREMIIDSAIEMVREKGSECINARDLGDYMGCSSRPLFTAFRNMDELIDAVRMEASARFLDSVRAARDAKSAGPAAKRMGMCIVRYAQTEPNLYKFIHWTGRKMFDVEELSRIMATQYQTDYQLSDEDAKSFFDHMMIFNMGLCSLITNGMRQFAQGEVERILLEQFSATLAYYKSGKRNIEEKIQTPPSPLREGECAVTNNKLHSLLYLVR